MEMLWLRVVTETCWKSRVRPGLFSQAGHLHTGTAAAGAVLSHLSVGAADGTLWPTLCMVAGV